MPAHKCTYARKHPSIQAIKPIKHTYRIHTGYIQYTADKHTNNKVYSTEMGIKTVDRGCLNQSWTTELAEVWLQLTKLGKFSSCTGSYLEDFTMNNRLDGAVYLYFFCILAPDDFGPRIHVHLLDGLKPPDHLTLVSDAWTATRIR